jgi:4-amino-4-deoxy-L-arabinose transferase-like glycosyltransferase
MANDASTARVSFLDRGENSALNRKLAFLFICAGILISCTGLLDPIFSGDSALYAVISKSFVTSGNFLDIYVNGKDWLDKPHFPFWLAAVSMKLFGVSGFAYKLPSVMLFIVGLIYTYKLAERLYDRDTALLAVLILTYPLHIFISNNDVRAESILIGLIMGGIYHFYRSTVDGGIIHIVLGSLFCAAAMMTKGPFVLIVFVSAIGGYLAGKRDYRGIFTWKWILAGGLILLFVSPELAALYWQFDAHLEKEILGATNVSGLKFFVWDTQFGRFFNSGPFKGSGSPAFYLHTLLWAFAPWGVIAYFMLARRLGDRFRKRPAREYLTLAGFGVMFIVFSASKFQLPYYTNILFPFLAIICADGLMNNFPISKLSKRVMWSTSLLLMSLVVVVTGALEFAFNGYWLLVPSAGCVFLLGLNAVISRFESQPAFRSVYCLATIVGSFALYANFVFYPHLLQYQAGSEAAIFANATLPGVRIGYSEYDNLMEFYADAVTVPVASALQVSSIAEAGRSVFFVDRSFRDRMDGENVHYRVVKEFADYRITRLTSQFLNPRTRAESVTTKYLISVE